MENIEDDKKDFKKNNNNSSTGGGNYNNNNYNKNRNNNMNQSFRKDAPTNRPDLNNTGGAKPYNRDNNNSGQRTYNNNNGEQRPYNNNGGQRTYNNNGEQRPYNRDNNNGGQRTYNNNGEQRPYNRDNNNNGQRPYNNNGGQRTYNNNGEQRPYNRDNNNNGQRPYNNNGGQRTYNNNGEQRPYNRDNNNGGQRTYNNNGEQRPYNRDNNNNGQRPYNNNGGQRPYNNNNGGQRPYNNNGSGGGQRPYNNNNGQGGYNNRGYNNGNNRVFLKDEDKEARPNNGQRRPVKSKTDQMLGKLDLQPTEKQNTFKGKSKKDVEKKLKKEESFDREDDLAIKKSLRKEKKADEKITKLLYTDGMSLNEVAEALKVAPASLLMKFMSLGYIMNLNSFVTREQAEMLCLELNLEYELQKLTDLMRFDEFEIEDTEEELVKRPPIVTIMGHVDHGKTTLLDTIRNSRVVKGEAGGITQHIGAYQVERKGEMITFIDTPGHAAFSEMRARGAQVTDICVLVVAADDGVMPQTEEAIAHAKQAGVPIIVAVNKIDKPQSNIEKIMQELSNFDLLPEEWGGKTIYCKVSALKGEGIENLLDMIQLLAEVESYKANPNRLASGTVIEAKMDKGRGNVATIIVQTGTLRNGDCIVLGNVFGKVRTMQDDLNRKFKEAGPSMAIEITGLDGTPFAGDKFLVFEDEREAKSIASKRLHKAWVEERGMSKAVSLESMFSDIKEGEKKHLHVLVKADTQGSCEAIKASLEKLSNDEVTVSIIRCSVGAISDEDVNLALVSDAIIVGFNIRPNANVRETAKLKNVEIRFYNIIYRMIEEIEQGVKGLLKPVFEEVVTGQAQVRELFVVSKVGTIAGCYVTDGVIERNSLVRIMRNGVVVFEGKMKSLKRFKDDVKEVKYGYDCGIMIEDFNDLKMDDVIEASVMKEVEKK